MHSNKQDVSIDVNEITKDYKLYARPLDRILETISPNGRRRHKTFTALKGVSFKVFKGETIGLIGPNGSGKSTLLEILCGTLNQTSGTIKTSGRIAALLELGAGFNPEFTGRENVYLNSSVMGIPQSVVDQKIQRVIDFAEIGDYIDRPVKTYSSGMYVRLAFAAAINMDPEILIVDEALSVGDLSFQRKCYRHFQELQRLGVTIIFVTHATDLIRAHCHRAVYIERGEVKSVGDPRDVVHAYLNALFARPETTIRQDDHSDIAIMSTDNTCETQPGYNPTEYRWGNRNAEIINYELFANNSINPLYLENGDAISIKMYVRFFCELEKIIYGLTIKTVDGITVFGSNTRLRGNMDITIPEHSVDVVEFQFTNNLLPGEYFISLGVAVDDDSVDNLAIDRRYDLIHCTVQGDATDFGISNIGLNIIRDEQMSNSNAD